MTTDDRARNVAALSIAGPGHRIGMARAEQIAVIVIRELERIGWGGRPDRIDLEHMSTDCDWGDCDKPAYGLRWDKRGRTYLPVCFWHLDAVGATGGVG